MFEREGKMLVCGEEEGGVVEGRINGKAQTHLAVESAGVEDVLLCCVWVDWRVLVFVGELEGRGGWYARNVRRFARS